MQRMYKILKGKGLSRMFPKNFFAKLAVRKMTGDHIANVQDFKMTVPIEQDHGMVLYLKGVYEPAVTKFIKFFLKEGQTFVDVGACLGYYSLLASHIVKEKGRVYAFEPERDNLDYLYENRTFSKFENIEIIDKAASDVEGELPLYISDHIGCHSLLHSELSGHINDRFVKTIPVDKCINRIDMIKIDVEGWEYYVLKGAESFFVKNENPIMVFMEYCPSLLKENLQLGYNLLSFIENYASSIFIIDAKKKKLRISSVEELSSLDDRVNLAWWS